MELKLTATEAVEAFRQALNEKLDQFLDQRRANRNRSPGDFPDNLTPEEWAHHIWAVSARLIKRAQNQNTNHNSPRKNNYERQTATIDVRLRYG